jgi:CDP-2,3-bis-(O-geranylgeranyl)-sn-glycerol synthase
MIILQALYFMLPAYIANMTPVFATKLFGKRFSTPVDFGYEYKGKPLLGSHKTWRGLITGVVIGTLVFCLQRRLYGIPVLESLSLFDYSATPPILYGLLLSFGALFGDMVKSLIKRRLHVQPGKKFIPWDQVDFIIGALIFISLVYLPSWTVMAIVIVFSPVLHIAANQLGYALKIKNTPW